MTKQMLIDMVSTPIEKGGITKRELFAAMAMQGIRAWGAKYTDEDARMAPYATVGLGWASKDVARLAINDADALIKALAEPSGEGRT